MEESQAGNAWGLLTNISQLAITNSMSPVIRTSHGQVFDLGGCEETAT